jgi:hypothetical protein
MVVPVSTELFVYMAVVVMQVHHDTDLLMQP